MLKALSRVPRALPGRHRPSRRGGDEVAACHSICVIAQTKPASSRAAATATTVRRLARASSLAQVRWRRCWADQEIATALAG